MSVLRRPGAQLASLLLLATLLLGPAAFGGFVWDDHRLIVDSATLPDLSNVPGYFARNLQQSSGEGGRAADGLDIYRPLYLTALALLHRIDGPNPLPFHVALLALHLLASTLLYLLVRRLVPDGPGWGPGFAFLAFALHPVTAESALWISAVSEPMAAVALLGATLLLLDRPSAGRAAAAGALFFAGLLSKEVIVMALPLLSLWLWRRGLPPRRLLPLWLAAAAMVGLRLLALDGLQAAGDGGAQRWLALQHLGLLWWHGLGALAAQGPVGPMHLYFEYVDLPAGLGIAGLAAFAAAGGLLWMRRRRAPLLGLGVGIYASMLLPVALVTTLGSWGGFGRYLYMPWAFLLLGGLELVSRTQLRLAPALAAVWLIGSALGLSGAIEAYSSPLALAQAALRLQPDAPVPHEWMGEEMLDQGRVQDALPWLERAVALAPQERRPRINLAAALVASGRAEEALDHVGRHESRFGRGARSSFIKARSLIVLGRVDEAAAVLLFALEQAPDEGNLQWLAFGLYSNHPEPERYRSWLRAQLPDHPNAARVLAPLLAP